MREGAPAPADARFRPVLDVLHRARAAMRVAAAMQAIAAGAACGAGVAAVASAAGWLPSDARTAALGCGAVVCALLFALFSRRCTTARAAQFVERGAPHLHNLLVTIEQLSRQPARVHPVVAGEIARQASAAMKSVVVRNFRLARGPALLAAVMVCGALIFASSLRSQNLGRSARVENAAVSAAAKRGTLTVHVIPPLYTGRAASTVREPAQVHVLEGSQVRLEVAGHPQDLEIADPAGSVTTLARQGSIQTIAFAAHETRFLLIRAASESALAPRALALIVQRDERPAVRIAAPAQDLAFSAADGRIAVAIDASDDLGLADLSLRYTHVAGSGETFSFKEGTLPIRIERQAPGRWRASGELRLSALGLQTGDTVVYRALARDLKPGGEPSASDSYLVEIGSVSGISSEGFALPEEKDRHAISQQMVIVKTERLLAGSQQLGADALLEQSRLLAVEQRMVRAEFVFMTGGTVEDEVEEAAHSHDLVEGRFENEGARELLTAIREMSRAEAALNEASLPRALVFERAALLALQRAFDRRRYFLKTVPERARIDPSRRLTGERREADSTSRQVRDASDSGELERLRTLSEALARLPDHGRGDLAEIAVRVGTVAPADPAVQTVSLRLAAAEGATPRERRTIISEALRLLSARMRAAVGPPAANHLPERDVRGHFANERSPEGPAVPRRSPGGS